MLKYLENHTWLYILLGTTIVLQGLSFIPAILMLLLSIIDYIYLGIFELSDVQIRTVITVVFLNIPAMIFWFVVFMLSKRDKSKLKSKEILC